ncbi:MAG: DegT/DnrJ/EryC1/StrS family aminotransferase [Phycisphaerales bacterium]|nr:DegT/DnrJ/EryC1/StrS family aminotransferase [Phycisphaerales bacterium]
MALHHSTPTAPQHSPTSLTPWPILDDTDRKAVETVLNRGVLYRGPEVPALEREWSTFTGSRYVLGVSSCTHAIQVALAALGVGPGDEVIVPAYTFIGTALPILRVGATPVFVDVDWDTCTPTVEAVCGALTPRTRAVVPVHLHGISVDVPAISAALQGKNIVVVEDACQAPGARIRGQHVGTLGDIGCFSLNAVKNLPAGQGGLVCTNDPRLADRIRGLASHGIGAADSIVEPGFSFTLTELAAAIARTQLRKLAERSAASRRNASLLRAALAGLPAVSTPVVPPDSEPSWHKFLVRLDLAYFHSGALSRSHIRDQAVARLCDAGVPSEVWQRKPLPMHPVFGSLPATSFPQAARLLDSSFVVGTETYPIVAQTEDTVREWSQVLRRVLLHLRGVDQRDSHRQHHPSQMGCT